MAPRPHRAWLLSVSATAPRARRRMSIPKALSVFRLARPRTYASRCERRYLLTPRRHERCPVQPASDARTGVALQLRPAREPAGYRSDVISLAGRRNLDDPNVGTIMLHSMVHFEGLTTSATSALAPKEARKAFEKGLDAKKKTPVRRSAGRFLESGRTLSALCLRMVLRTGLGVRKTRTHFRRPCCLREMHRG